MATQRKGTLKRNPYVAQGEDGQVTLADILGVPTRGARQIAQAAGPIVEGAVRGASAGLIDPAAAALESALTSRTYQQVRAGNRAAQQAQEAAYPGLTTVGNVLGVIPAAAVALPRATAAVAPRFASALGGVPARAVEGALMSATAAGTAGGTEEDVLRAAGVGAALPAALGTIGVGVQKALHTLAKSKNTEVVKFLKSRLDTLLKSDKPEDLQELSALVDDINRGFKISAPVTGAAGQVVPKMVSDQTIGRGISSQLEQALRQGIDDPTAAALYQTGVTAPGRTLPSMFSSLNSPSMSRARDVLGSQATPVGAALLAGGAAGLQSSGDLADRAKAAGLVGLGTYGTIRAGQVLPNVAARMQPKLGNFTISGEMIPGATQLAVPGAAAQIPRKQYAVEDFADMDTEAPAPMSAPASAPKSKTFRVEDYADMD